jgi:DNA-binding NarL/FixJ family response regulator
VTEPISVLLADDHAIVRRGFRRMLEDDPSIRVVGEANDGDEAVRLAASLLPKVIVMDVSMPGLGGIPAARAILKARPETAIVMLSMHSEETLIRQAVAAGVRGYVLKGALLDLAAVVHRVAAGETVLESVVSDSKPLQGERPDALTPRELEVLQLICSGKSNREIAVDLDLSANTVAVHRANIMNTLGIHKTAELVVYAIRNGLVSLS